MSPRLDLEIRSRVADYVSDELGFEAFEDWLVANTWSADDTAVRDLVAEIELSIAEFTGGDVDEAQLRDRLQPLAMTYFVDLRSEVERVTAEPEGVPAQNEDLSLVHG